MAPKKSASKTTIPPSSSALTPDEITRLALQAVGSDVVLPRSDPVAAAEGPPEGSREIGDEETRQSDEVDEWANTSGAVATPYQPIPKRTATLA